MDFHFSIASISLNTTYSKVLISIKILEIQEFVQTLRNLWRTRGIYVRNHMKHVLYRIDVFSMAIHITECANVRKIWNENIYK